MTVDLHQTTSFVIEALPADVLAVARAQAPRRADRRGGPQPLVAAGGEPLRCCLTDATPGEHVLLVSYRPPLPAPSPYQEVGAVFVHADAGDCPGHTPSGRYPEAWRGRPQVLRAYDGRGHIHPATRVHDGAEPERVVAEVLADPDVVLVHSRNVAYGCYMFAVVRPRMRR
jgi:hypothetical protein